jgi:CPA1 family monovalent cation:H+ antiporter
MPALELVLALLLAVALLALAARRLHVPYPIVLVVGGLAIGLVPGLPPVTLAPDAVFLVFLPPLVFAAGWFTSLRDFKANIRPIGLLSIGLVLFTTVGIAVVAHAVVPKLSWAAAFLLGAIVSPTDTVAPLAIFQRLGVPRRVQTVLEGESLVNDATGLIVYRYALAAVLTGAFSLWQAGAMFVYSAVAGLVIGIAAAWLFDQVQARMDDPPIGITFSFLLPYGVYIGAEAIHASGVLAVAAAGVLVSRRSAVTMSAEMRTQATAAWRVALFVLNGLVFILIGLQLPTIVSGLGAYTPQQLAGDAAKVCLAVIAIRFVWVFPATYLPRFLSRHLRARDPYPPWRDIVVVAWTGMRGVVSLAAALALQPFTGRDEIVFLTFCVILVTLVFQGLTLPALLRWLRIGDGKAEEAEEELEARSRAIESAIQRLEDLAAEDWTNETGLAYMRTYYGKRRHTLATRFGRVDHDHDGEGRVSHDHEEGRDHAEAHQERLNAFDRLKRETLDAERATVIALRNSGVIADSVMQRVERDLDLEELRLAAPS